MSDGSDNDDRSLSDSDKSMNSKSDDSYKKSKSKKHKKKSSGHKSKRKEKKHEKRKGKKKKRDKDREKSGKKKKHRKESKYESDTDIGPELPPNLPDQSRNFTPMSKEQWDAKQKEVKRVFDEETGRYRLIRGTGEILEEIVSKERHKEINKQSTLGDGEYFQNVLAKKL